jgi:transposase InsO family protein
MQEHSEPCESTTDDEGEVVITVDMSSSDALVEVETTASSSEPMSTELALSAERFALAKQELLIEWLRRNDTERLEHPVLRKRPSMFEPPSGKGWDHLTSKEKKEKLRQLQRACLQKEELIIKLLKLRVILPHHKLPRGVLAEVRRIFADLSVSTGDGPSERWIQILMRDYLMYRLSYPTDPSAEFFMPLPKGRPRGQLLTEQQKSVIRYALANRERLMRSAIGRIRNVDLDFAYREVWDFTAKICPMPSYDTIRRYIHYFRQAEPALFALMVEGEDVVERALLLKKRNEVSRPNERWQADARDLPWYVLHNGKPHRVTLLVVYDDYSRYIVWWRLILKREIDDDETPQSTQGKRPRTLRKKREARSTTFTAIDVLTLYLTAMYRTGVRPECIYTDNGSQFIAAEKYLLLLTLANEVAIAFAHTRPGKPWGRGKIENGLGQVNRLLKRVPGTYNKRDRKSIRDARTHKELYSFEEAEAEIAEHFKEINERKRKNAPSRFDIWRSVVGLPAPPIRQLALVEEKISEQKDVTVSGWAIHFDGREWEPKSIEALNKQIYRRWMDAVARDEKAWLCGVKLDIGWRVEVRLGDMWIELVPKADQQANPQHNADQAQSLRDLRHVRDTIIASDGQIVHELTGGELPIGEASSGAYAAPALPPPAENDVPSDQKSETDLLSNQPETAESSKPRTQSSPKQRKTRSSKNAQAHQSSLDQQSEGAFTEADTFDDLPDLDDLLNKVYEQLARSHP